MQSTAYWTVRIFSAFSSGISISKASSKAIPSSTVANGSSRVPLYPPARELPVPCLGQSAPRRLRSRVIRLRLFAHHSDHRGDVHQGTAPLLGHGRQDSLGAVERALQVDVQHRIPVFFLHAEQQAVPRDARIVHQDVDAAELGDHPVGHRRDVGPFGHVRLDDQRAASLRRHRLRRLLGAGYIEVHHRHIRPVPRQGLGDRAPNPLGSARHDRDFPLEHHGRAAASASTVAARLVRSCTLNSRSSGTIRLASPERTLPGPTSTSVWIPILTSARTDSSHKTGRESCRTNDVRTSEALRIGLASALLISGTVRSCIGTRSTSTANRAAAACMSDVCTGTLTGKGMTLRQPLALAWRAASSTAAFSPAITIWPGALKFAGATTPNAEAERQTSATTVRSRPRMAHTRPRPASTASCM